MIFKKLIMMMIAMIMMLMLVTVIVLKAMIDAESLLKEARLLFCVSSSGHRRLTQKGSMPTVY